MASEARKNSHKTLKVIYLYVYIYYRKDMACLSRKEIIESVKQSLINLGMDYIDLIIIHKSDTSCPMEGTFRIPNLFKLLVDFFQIKHKIMPPPCQTRRIESKDL
jgi:aryl-alcohol dehydrogenase-like predicted oxidoreductase